MPTDAAGTGAPGGSSVTSPPGIPADDGGGEPFHPPWADAELWEALFEAAPLPYALVELGTQRAVANRSCAELFGYEHRPLRWREIMGVGHPDDRAVTDDVLRRVHREGLERAEYEKRYLRADGSVFHAQVHVSVLRWDDGRPWGALLAFQDVTERREAERALADSEARLRALMANTSDATLIIDDQGLVVYASPAAEQLIGEPVEPHLGKDIFRWAHPDDRPVGVEIFRATLENPGGVTGPLRIRMRRADGGVRFVETLAANLIDEPAVKGIVLNVRDLTDAEEVTSALEMTENRYRRMLENISDTVTLVDEDARIILTTGNLRPVMGYPLDFWEGLDGFQILHPEDVEQARERFDRLLARPGSEFSGEVRIRQPDGMFRDVELNAVNLLDAPEVEAIVITSRDITARNQVQRELARARDQALTALDERTKFIANVSHELRTPIHGILGLSELLATTDLDDDARTLARSIGRATDSLRMVLDDILDFSKIEVGRLETTSEPINVRELTADVGALFQAQARAKNVTLRADIEPGFPPHVWGDALRIRQVLNNLIGNAIKFTSEGTVTVTARKVDGPNPRAWVSIRDTGIGIRPEAHERLFEPFSQAYGSTGREYGGTGLGLAIAKRLVELMGGELGFSSQPGRGSEFWFALPLREAVPRPFTDDDRLRPVGDEAGLRVLVVEDNAINQLLVRRQLARLGYEPLMVASGDEALDAFPTLGVDLVLMDWQLPGIDGLETTRRLRAWERSNGRRRTPVIAMTASALPGDREQCLAAGMDDFIAKPVSIGTLGATVRQWGTRRPEDAGGGPAAAPIGEAGEDLPVVDPAALELLTEELDDPALVATVVRTFRRELPGRVEWIAGACADGDPVRLELMTHTLRSTSLAVGARALARECERLERTARDREDGTGWDAEPLRAAAHAVLAALGAGGTDERAPAGGYGAGGRGGGDTRVSGDGDPVGLAGGALRAPANGAGAGGAAGVPAHGADGAGGAAG